MDTHPDITINGETRRIAPTRERERSYLEKNSDRYLSKFQLTVPQSY